MEEASFSKLSGVEIRVLGSLIEKSQTTPDYYPMTLNSIKNACNQKSARYPVVNYEERTVMHALGTLRTKGFVSTIPGGRVMKYKHKFLFKLPIGKAEMAVLCLLMLRGPLTSGAINSNSARLYDFENLSSVNEVLQKLMEMSPALVRKIARKPGQVGERYIHLLSDYEEEEEEVAQETADSNVFSRNLEDRVAQLEARLAAIEEKLSSAPDTEES